MMGSSGPAAGVGDGTAVLYVIAACDLWLNFAAHTDTDADTA